MVLSDCRLGSRQEAGMLFTLLLFMLLNYKCSHGYSSQALQDCDVPEAGVAYYRVGQTVSLCFTFSESECGKLTDDDVMSVVQSRQQHPDVVTNITAISCLGTPGENSSCGRCSYKYQKENASLSDDGDYSFKVNNNRISFTTVHIMEKPSPAKILSLSVTELFVMTVEFEKGKCFPWSNDFKVSMKRRNNVTPLCSMTCSSCQDTCICQYSYTSSPIFRDNVTLSVDTLTPSENTTVQTASWSGTFSLFQHLVPSKVEDLKLFSVGVDEAVIMFRPSGGLLRYTAYMEDSSKPLYYRINLTRTHGLSEVLTVEFKKTVFTVSEYPYQFVAVRLTNMTHFTDYSVSVAGVGGGGEGCSTILTFTTNKSEPLRPPRIGDFTYTRILGDRNTSSLHLLWQHLPLASRGGSHVFYHLVLTSSQGSTLNETSVSSNYILLDGLPSRDPLTVKIWAKNEVGRSKDYSQIKIPAYQDVQPVMYVEYDLHNNMSYVWLNLSGYDSVEKIAIHRCDVSQGSLCTMYPYTKIEAVNSSNSVGLLMFDMPLAIPVILTTVDVIREVTYFNTEDGGNPYQKPPGYTVYANVSFQMDESDGLWDVDNKDDYPRIYFSLRVNGTWLGMVRTSCYFNRNLATVDLVQYADLDGQKPYLRFIQHCDTDVPKQFLAERFIVYTLTNDTDNGWCDGPNRQKIGEVANEMFRFHSIDLPSGMRLACVEAVGYNTSTSYISKAIPYEAAPVSQSTQVISENDLIITAILSVLGGLAAVFIMYVSVVT